MAKKMYNDQYNSQYGHISSIIYNAPGGKKLAIKPAFHKQTVQNPLANHLANKMTISSIPSIYSKKVDEGDFGFSGFGSKENQIVFIRKVYFGVLLQLVLVVSLQCVSKFVSKFKDKYKESGYFHWIPLSSTILSLIILACCEFHRRYPYNYIATTYFTCSAGMFLMHVSTKIDMIFYTIIIFTASIIGLTIFTCQTKFKYTIYTGLGTILICDIIAFVSLFVTEQDYWTSYLYSEILASVFLLFFVIDIQIMVSGNHKYEIRESENVFATMTLYTDIVNLFIYVLQLLNSAKD